MEGVSGGVWVMIGVGVTVGWWAGRFLPVAGGWLFQERMIRPAEYRWGKKWGSIGLSLGGASVVWLAKDVAEALLALALLLFLLMVVWTDCMRGIIPNRLNGIGAVVFILLQGVRGEAWVPLLVASVAGMCLLGLVSLLSGGGMGGGDVKMAAAAGWALGWPALGAGLGLAIISGGLTALWLWMSRRVEGKTPVPFGPHLAIGFFVAFWYGEELTGWYLSLVNE
ncbi:A24 family peptidase [Desmospora profundinema]|uniref:Prepilin signal peptidase PulO-like enzyme (Type II secretory pathway) n=1 Tax=Desmospora profundinema TaxID=1571184 RepID=A0ABU1IPU8_9BACL|nr:A24 family peptidase [Desmospora profundinema]MDR6226428.1 prepilin signal peptidase PulO-like enzyme (type II secretory pathway) [Desmospora profundinema]